MTELKQIAGTRQEPKLYEGFQKVYIPFLDTLSLAGPDSIRQFEDHPDRDTPKQKHLVVLQMDTLHKLQRVADQPNHEDSADALSLLNFVAEMNFQEDIPKPVPGTDNLFAMLRDGPELTPQMKGDDMTTIKFLLGDNFDPQNVPAPRLVTNVPVNKIAYGRKGFTVEDSRFDKVDPAICDRGLIRLEGRVAKDLAQQIEENEGTLDLRYLEDRVGNHVKLRGADRLIYPNQFYLLKTADGEILTRVTGDVIRSAVDGNIVEHANPRLEAYSPERFQAMMERNIFGIVPRDLEQALEYELLLDPDVELVVVSGLAGSGKTLLAYSAMVAQVLAIAKQQEAIATGHAERGPMSDKAKERFKRKDKKKDKRQHIQQHVPQSFMSVADDILALAGRYKTMYVGKSLVSMGGENTEKKIGALPGDLKKKIGDYYDSYMRNHLETGLKTVPFDTMFQNPFFPSEGFEMRKSKFPVKPYAFPAETAVLQLLDFWNWRGSSVTDSVMMVDDAQDFSTKLTRDLIQRAGSGTKVVLIGDPIYQRDNLKTTTLRANGVVSTVAHYTSLGAAYFGHIQTHSPYRSASARDAANWVIRS